jgi:hypothetical protein
MQLAITQIGIFLLSGPPIYITMISKHKLKQNQQKIIVFLLSL